MSTLSDIREGIAAQLLAKLRGVYVYDHMTDTIQAPAVAVFAPTLVDFLEAYTTTAKRYEIPLKLIVQRVDAQAADDAMDTLLDQVVAALLVNPSLSGACDSMRVGTADGFGTVDVGTVTYLGCDLHVEVFV